MEVFWTVDEIRNAFNDHRSFIADWPKVDVLEIDGPDIGILSETLTQTSWLTSRIEWHRNLDDIAFHNFCRVRYSSPNRGPRVTLLTSRLESEYQTYQSIVCICYKFSSSGGINIIKAFYEHTEQKLENPNCDSTSWIQRQPKSYGSWRNHQRSSLQDWHKQHNGQC